MTGASLFAGAMVVLVGGAALIWRSHEDGRLKVVARDFNLEYKKPSWTRTVLEGPGLTLTVERQAGSAAFHGPPRCEVTWESARGSGQERFVMLPGATEKAVRSILEKLR